MRCPACSADGTDTVLWKYALKEHYSDQHKGQEVPAVFVLCEKEKRAMSMGMQGKQKRSTRRQGARGECVCVGGILVSHVACPLNARTWVAWCAHGRIADMLLNIE
jgi:hypothetical protein